MKISTAVSRAAPVIQFTISLYADCEGGNFTLTIFSDPGREMALPRACSPRHQIRGLVVFPKNWLNERTRAEIVSMSCLEDPTFKAAMVARYFCRACSTCSVSPTTAGMRGYFPSSFAMPAGAPAPLRNPSTFSALSNGIGPRCCHILVGVVYVFGHRLFLLPSSRLREPCATPPCSCEEVTREWRDARPRG